MANDPQGSVDPWCEDCKRMHPAGYHFGPPDYAPHFHAPSYTPRKWMLELFIVGWLLGAFFGASAMILVYGIFGP